MKRNIFKICLAALIVSGTFTSCSNDREDKFDELSSVRESKQAKELEELLFTADHGWKLQYFTDDTELGGYTFLMKFHGGNYVEMISDFDEDGYKLQGSEYQIQLRGTTSLVFVTENKIHKLSDPYNSPTTNAEGYKGDFQFRYYGKTENEIIFRGTKDIKKEIRFVKATAEDWENFDKRKPYNEALANVEVPIFRKVSVESNGAVKEYDGMFNDVTRFFTLSNGGDGGKLGLEKDGFAIAYTNEGAILSKPMIVDGQEIKNFKYDANGKFLVSTDSESVKVKLLSTNIPVDWSDSYKSLVFGKNEVITFIQTGRDAAIRFGRINTQKYYDAVRLENGEFRFTQFAMFMRNGTIQFQYSMNDGKTYSYNCSVSDSNGKGRLLLQNGRWSGTASNEVKEMHDKLFGSNILFVKEQPYRVGGGNIVVSYISGGDSVAFDTWVN